MSKDVNKEFDSLVRSMLEDAEVKAPSGVWRAVSSRLETKPAAKWGWIAAPLALASVVLGVVLFGLRIGTTSIPTDSLAVVSEEVVNTVSSPEAPAEVAAGIEVRPAGTAFEAKREMAASAPRTVAEPAGGNAAQDETEAAASAAPTPKAPKAEPKKPAAAPGAFPDPFAAMEREDACAKKSSGVILTAGGTVSGSENGRSLIASRTSGVAAKSLQDNIIETSTSTFSIPFTIGAGVLFRIGERFSIGTGLNFSLLTRTFTGQYTPVGGVMTEGDITHTLVYLGIPLNFQFTVLDSNDMRFYAFADGEIEYAVSNSYNIRSISKVISEAVSGPQLSVGGGVGVEFKVGRRVGLYLDPGVNYYFNTNQPKSVRTERPLMFNLDGGLRFDF